MNKQELDKLTALGFDTSKDRTSTINTHRRLIMALCAMEKQGKTTFGLTLPKPIMYLNFDRKIEEATLGMLGVSHDDLYIREIRTDAELAQDEHRKSWDQVQSAILWALQDSDSIRSIVIDTESEMWELARMAAFGKLSQVMPHQYTQLNAAYKYLLDQCDRHNKNVLFLRKMKKQYKSDVWTGRYEPAGFGKVKDIVQVNAEMYTEQGDDGEDVFTFEIINNGISAGMNHQTFSGEMCSFPWVASMLTMTGMEEWE